MAWIFIHDLDPVALQLGPLAIRWYGIGYLVGFLLGAWIIRRVQLSAYRAPGMGAEEPVDFLTWAILSVLIGGRLGHVILYDAAYYAARPLEILFIWRGGMSFHGGLLGLIVATYMFARIRSIPVFSIMDVVSLSGCAGVGIVRITNFVNGELWGRPIGDMAPVGVVFPAAGPEPRHPSQLYESVLEGFLPLALLTLVVLRFRGLSRPGLILGLFLIFNGVGRIVSEFLRAEEVFVGELFMGITWGQVLTLPQVGIGLLVLWLAPRFAARFPVRQAKKRRKA